MPTTGHDLRRALDAADSAANARLNAHIDALWAAKADPDAARALLRALAGELLEVRSNLEAASHAHWWRGRTLSQIVAVYEGARVWSRSDPDCDELERLFVAMLRDHFEDDSTPAANPRTSTSTSSEPPTGQPLLPRSEGTSP